MTQNKKNEVAQYVFDRYITSKANMTITENEREKLITFIKKAVTKTNQLLEKTENKEWFGIIRIYDNYRIDYFINTAGATNQKIYSVNKELYITDNYEDIKL